MGDRASHFVRRNTRSLGRRASVVLLATAAWTDKTVRLHFIYHGEPIPGLG
jgi:hypothetical protein